MYLEGTLCTLIQSDTRLNNEAMDSLIASVSGFASLVTISVKALVEKKVASSSRCTFKCMRSERT